MIRTTIIAAALAMAPLYASTPATTNPASPAPATSAPTPAPAVEQSNEKNPLSGSLTLGYNTNYVGRGIVISHSVAEGDSSEFVALKLGYDFGGGWSYEGTIAYTMVSSGHTLYGNPSFGPTYRAMAAQIQAAINAGMIPADQIPAAQAIANKFNGKIKEANIENEFAVVNALKYTQKYWNVSFGHDFIHGGLLGVMAKHYRDRNYSRVNEIFISPEWTPAPWVSLGCTIRYSIASIPGWWFEPTLTFKAPIIGTPEDVKLAGIMQIGLSATGDYFESHYFACKNGTQAFWVKFMFPYFVTDNFIVTPSLSLNWLGKGAINANKASEYAQYSENPNNIPFRNFGVVAGVSCTVTF